MFDHSYDASPVVFCRMSIGAHLVIVLTLVISACSAVGVLESSDPAVKLAQAERLFEHETRPLPAEYLILQALHISEERGDAMGIAEAYRMYGLFFRSRAVTAFEKIYRSHGFEDKTVSFDGRFSKAIEYFEQAAQTFQERGLPDRLSNVYFHIGETYSQMNDSVKACKSFDASVREHALFVRNHPGASIDLPLGFSSFEDVIALVREQAGCK